jgi:hypothetical protein
MKKNEFLSAALVVGIMLISMMPTTGNSQTQQPPKQVVPQKGPIPGIAVPTSKVSISSAVFEKIAYEIFNGASFSANSCGGADAVRATKIVVPGSYQKSDPIGRLDASLPDKVQRQTMREAISYSKNPDVIRDAKIRACPDNLGTLPWKGSIENGKFKIKIQLNSNLFIKTRKMEEKKTGSGWEERFDWNSWDADHNIPDYVYVAPCMDVYLTPAVQDGTLSYAVVDVIWSWFKDEGFFWPQGALVSDPFAIPWGHPLEKSMILSYKTEVMNTMKQRIVGAFQDSTIRNRMKTLLTARVKSGEFSNRTIVSLSASTTAIIVNFN